MITIGSIREINTNMYDETWIIVRSLKTPIKNTKHVPDLSPSKELFYKYCELKKHGQWNTDTFQNIYVPWFLMDLSKNPNTELLLSELTKLDQNKKNIYLACFCPNETLCHRSIVAGILQNRGLNVKTETGNDYSSYDTAYMQTRDILANAITSFHKPDTEFLSNMHTTPITYNGITYTCAEAAFQAQKCPMRSKEFESQLGGTAKHMGRRVELRSDWDFVKDQIMKEIIDAKFANKNLAKQLIATGDKYLIEGNTWHDTYWGVDINTGLGQNKLGKILMAKRAELIAQNK